MAQPISFKGKVNQYAGRLHRNCEGKTDVKIYDYVDVHIHMFERMYHKRLSAYKSIGYTLKTRINSVDEGIFDVSGYFELLVNDIENANNRVVIESKSIGVEQLNKIKGLLAKKFRAGVKIIIVTSEYNRNCSLNELDEVGLNIIHKKGYCRNYVSIDHEILWYGSIVPLGKSSKEDTIIRIYTSSAEAIFNGKTNE